MEALSIVSFLARLWAEGSACCVHDTWCKYLHDEAQPPNGDNGVCVIS